MIRRSIRAAFALALVLAPAPSARACPLCDSATGVQVRSGIFGADFGPNLAATLLPFPLFLAIVALIHFGPPWSRNPTGPGPDEPPPSKDQT